MDWLIVFCLLFGCATGIITGLVPGLHTNTVALLVVASLSTLTKWFSSIAIATFLTGLVIVHSFLSFIPSIFLGAPDEATALSVMPGHKMLLRGQGFHALKLTIAGGIGAYFVSLLVLPLLFVTLPILNQYASYFVVPLLIFFATCFILTERGLSKKVWALLLFLLSGVLGLIVLNNLNIENSLFPLLSGLFGMSSLIASLADNTVIKKQTFSSDIKIFGVKRFLSYIKATVSSAIISILPAVGAAQAATIARGFVKSKDDEEYLVVVGGISTAGSTLALTTLYIAGKARTGVLAAMKEFMKLELNDYLILIAASFVALSIGIILTYYLGKLLANNITKINYKLLTLAIITFVVLLVGLFSGWLGILVLSISTAMGMIAPIVGTKRTHVMGCLVIPVVSYFL